jgi:hypothetical protein
MLFSSATTGLVGSDHFFCGEGEKKILFGFGLFNPRLSLPSVGLADSFKEVLELLPESFNDSGCGDNEVDLPGTLKVGLFGD